MTSLLITPTSSTSEFHPTPAEPGVGFVLYGAAPALELGTPLLWYHRRRGEGRELWFGTVAEVGAVVRAVEVCRVSVALPHTPWRRSIDELPQDAVRWLVYADWLAERRHPRRERDVRRVAEVLAKHFAAAVEDLGGP
jgi:uncharacterized protein (TIGR02996 family)